MPPNLRKAAVLIRSLDAETATALLAQLPPTEAAAVRAAVDSLGPIDADEQADVAAELRRAAPLAGSAASAGVELALSSAAGYGAATPVYDAPIGNQTKVSPRFEFLERAPITNLVPYLAREHVQTIAVVLSYLSPSRAAAVLAALPPRQQADTLERLSALGETDPDSLKVVEQELAAWVAAQSSVRRGARTGGAATAILAAADAATRERILDNLGTHKRHIAVHFGKLSPVKAPAVDRQPSLRPELPLASPRLSTQLDALRTSRTTMAERLETETPRRPRPIAPPPSARSRIQFDDLVRLDTRALAAVLRDVDAGVLVLALAGSSDELVDRIAGQMPKRTAKAFRRQLRRLGPTRLSDVEAAQQAVARAAARIIGRHAALAV
ncbi:MAG: FliG C-terminal domain-containing protein [Pirellulales bacterium]